MKKAKERPLHIVITDEVMELLAERGTVAKYNLRLVRSATGTVMSRRKIFEEEKRFNLLGKVVRRVRNEISKRNKMVVAANDTRRTTPSASIDMSYFRSTRFIKEQEALNMFSNPID